MYSAFGVDHGEISKAAEHWTQGSGMSPGRAVTAGLLPGPHGLVAGKKGKKLKAAGHEILPATAGSVVLPGFGGLIGGVAGANAAQNKGYYKGSKAIKVKPKKKEKEISKAGPIGAGLYRLGAKAGANPANAVRGAGRAEHAGTLSGSGGGGFNRMKTSMNMKPTGRAAKLAGKSRNFANGYSAGASRQYQAGRHDALGPLPKFLQ